MRLELVRIGNSRGIRLPKPLIAQCGLGDIVDVRVTPEGLFIAPHHAPRQGWEESFAASEPKERKLLLDKAPANAFDEKEWTW